MPSTLDLQARLAALGHPPGPLDGIMGRRTEAALRDALEANDMTSKADLFDASGLHRIHWHWTAGAEGVIDLEREHYHYLIGADGNVVEGLHRPEMNASTGNSYAAHTWHANTGAIGVAIDAMAGAKERPFDWGSAPMTWGQVDAMCRLTARLCSRYWIPVSRTSTLSHAEIQPTLNIRQRWKWDITILPGMDAGGDAVEIGDRLRAMTREHMQDTPEQSDDGLTDAEKAARYDRIVAIAAE